LDDDTIVFTYSNEYAAFTDAIDVFVNFVDSFYWENGEITTSVLSDCGITTSSSSSHSGSTSTSSQTIPTDSSTLIIIIVSVIIGVLVLAAAGVGTYFLVKHYRKQNRELQQQLL
jgi:hypothetical protein